MYTRVFFIGLYWTMLAGCLGFSHYHTGYTNEVAHTISLSKILNSMF